MTLKGVILSFVPALVIFAGGLVFMTNQPSALELQPVPKALSEAEPIVLESETLLNPISEDEEELVPEEEIVESEEEILEEDLKELESLLDSLTEDNFSEELGEVEGLN